MGVRIQTNTDNLVTDRGGARRIAERVEVDATYERLTQCLPTHAWQSLNQWCMALAQCGALDPLGRIQRTVIYTPPHGFEMLVR